MKQVELLKRAALASKVSPPAHNGAPQTGSQVAAWQAQLREAMFDAVNAQDITEIVRNLVVKAKKGDPAAVKLVMEYVLGGRGPQTVIQKNIVVDGDSWEPEAPTSARGGTRDKLAVFADRARKGEGLFHPADGPEDT